MPTPQVTVTGTLTDISGVANAGTVRFTLANFGNILPIITGSNVVAEVITTVQAAANGTFSVSLWGNYQISPTDTFYQVEVDANNGSQVMVAAYQFLAGGSYDLASISPIVNTVTLTPFIPIVANPIGAQTIDGDLTVANLVAQELTLGSGSVNDSIVPRHLSILDGSGTAFLTGQASTTPTAYLARWEGTPTSGPGYGAYGIRLDLLTKSGIDVRSAVGAAFFTDSYSRNSGGTATDNDTNQVALYANASALDPTGNASVYGFNASVATLYTGANTQTIAAIEADVFTNRPPGFWGAAGAPYAVGVSTVLLGGSDDGTAAFSFGSSAAGKSWNFGVVGESSKSAAFATLHGQTRPDSGLWVAEAVTYGVYIGAKALYATNSGAAPTFGSGPAVGIALGEIAATSGNSHKLRLYSTSAGGVLQNWDIYHDAGGILHFQYAGADKVYWDINGNAVVNAITASSVLDAPVFRTSASLGASVGAVRLKSADAIKIRNNANGSDLNLISKNTSDVTVVGDAAGAAFNGGITTKSVNSIFFADQYPGADLGAKINAASADGGANATIYVIASGTISTSLTLAAGTRLLFGAGYYTFTVQQNLTANDIVIKGAGRNSTAFYIDFADGDLFHVTGYAFHLSDVEIVAHPSITRTSGSAIDISGSLGQLGVYENLYIVGAYHFLTITGPSAGATHVYNVRVSGVGKTQGYAIKTYATSGTCASLILDHVDVYMTGDTQVEPSFIFDSLTDTVLGTNCGIATASGQTGIQCQDTDNVGNFPRWIHFVNTTVEAAGGTAIDLASVRDFKYVSSYVASAQNAVHIHSAAQDVVFSANIFTDITQHAVIVDASSTGWAFTGNNFCNIGTAANNTYDVFQIGAGTLEFIIANNSSRTLTGTTCKYGVEILAGSSANFSITGNNLGGIGTSIILNGATGNNWTVASNHGAVDVRSFSTGTWSLKSGATTTVNFDAATGAATFGAGLTLGGRLLLPPGSSSAPAVGFSADAGTGFYQLSTGNMEFVSSGAITILYAAALQRMGSAGLLGWGSNANPSLAIADVNLTRSGAGVLQVGTGETANASGTLAAAKVQLGGVTTILNGAPQTVAQVNQTAQSAAQLGTALYSVPAAGGGMYAIHYVATVTQAATTSSTLGGSNGFRVLYIDPDDSVSKASPVPGSAVAAVNEGFCAANNSANTTATQISGTYNVNAKASSNMSFNMDYTSSGATAMQYNLHIRVVYLG